MESIIQFRQMMADQKFFEVQKLIEVQLTLNTEARSELLSLYYETLVAQNKTVPVDIAVELAEIESHNLRHSFVLNMIKDLNLHRYEIFFSRIQKLKIRAAQDQGRMEDLYQLISEFLIRQFEKQSPSIPVWLTQIIETFFKNDFNINLGELAIYLQLGNMEKSEELTKSLIINSVEQSSPKGIKEKLLSVSKILSSSQKKGILEVYNHLCAIYGKGITEKSDYKKILEMVIFFDDFRFQTLLLNLLHQYDLNELAHEYALCLKENKNYDFVYFDKYFSELKKYFVTSRAEKEEPTARILSATDLEIHDNYQEQLISSLVDVEVYEDEKKYFHLLKYQTYTSDQLCDLAVSFIQAEMPKVALKASELAMVNSENNKSYLKASYLRLNCFLVLKDFRAALDTCMEALEKASTTDDILSFLYGQAEAYIRLDQPRDAKKVLQKIVSIDSSYRLAKERLDKLNEI